MRYMELLPAEIERALTVDDRTTTYLLDDVQNGLEAQLWILKVGKAKWRALAISR